MGWDPTGAGAKVPKQIIGRYIYQKSSLYIVCIILIFIKDTWAYQDAIDYWHGISNMEYSIELTADI